MGENASVSAVMIRSTGGRKISSSSNIKEYPISLSVYYQDDKRYYRTGIFLTEEAWSNYESGKRDSALKEIRIKLEAKVVRANAIINKMETFTFDAFRALYKGKKVDKTNFVELMQDYMDDLEENDRIGYVGTFVTTRNWLKKFRKRIRVVEVSTDFLLKFEDYLRTNGNKDSSIGINMRNVRTIYNVAIAKKIVPMDSYPFTSYNIPTSCETKRSLKSDGIKAVLNFTPKTASRKKAFKYWIFSYLSNGMNMADIAHLKKADIEVGFFSFHRVKTIRARKKNKTKIRVHIHPVAQEILDEFLNDPSLNNSPYVFPILKEGLSARTIKNRIRRHIKMVNDNMSEIARELKIALGDKRRLTSYVARHTFATVLKRKGIHYEEISEYLGHSSLDVTKAYMDSFEDDTIKKASNLLTDFADDNLVA